MENNVSENLKDKCRLHNFNSRKGIKKLFLIPDWIDLENLGNEVLNCYQFFYLKKIKVIKNDKLSKKEKNELKLKKYLCANELSDISFELPDDYHKDKYRMLINIKKDSVWLKKALKKINKYLSESLIHKERGARNKIKIVHNVSYLHSSVKKRSYETNAKEHKNKKYVLAIDIKNFYPSIKEYKIYNFFRKQLKLEEDIAKIYTLLCTCPLEDPKYNPKFEYGLGQGLATSPVLAYLINYKMFNYINIKASMHEINMTVYVDDIVFSSKSPIPQSFIDCLFKIVKQNSLDIKRTKVKSYKNTSIKKITGVYLTSTDVVRVSNSKHEEMMFQYKYLIESKDMIKNLNDYFNFLNLYLRFNGNVQFVKLIEGKTLKKYEEFTKNMKGFFPNGVKKKNKKLPYSKENLDDVEYKRILQKYNDLMKFLR